MPVGQQIAEIIVQGMGHNKFYKNAVKGQRKRGKVEEMPCKIKESAGKSKKYHARLKKVRESQRNTK
ncbi:hypothetical protein [Bacillus sp. Hm123]|uniref:hypothetical protein n=1 Tax=Bacillus sp. Hm123 TaxID=3450745 RepID=UPI003F421394